jgi:transcription elongation factor GreB
MVTTRGRSGSWFSDQTAAQNITSSKAASKQARISGLGAAFASQSARTCSRARRSVGCSTRRSARRSTSCWSAVAIGFAGGRHGAEGSVGRGASTAPTATLAAPPRVAQIRGMSKAFVREDAGAAEPEDEKVEFGPGPRYITPEGRRRLEGELERLLAVERPKLTREVAEAAALGDRSENAEYLYGKRRLREIDRRVRQLTKLLEKLTVVSEAPSDRERVFFGASVTVEDAAGQRATYRLVGPDETDAAAGRISVESPMARALLGKRAGDAALVRRPRGESELTVTAVRYP